jgi:phenylacetate-CoA ligase
MKPCDIHIDAERDRELTSPARFPVLSTAGRAMLHYLAGHPHAPCFRNFSGHRLDRAQLRQARWRHWRIQRTLLPPRREATDPPAWADAWVRQLAAGVPAHAMLRYGPVDWHHIPLVSRADLGTRLAEHVPASLPLQRLLCFSTSGSTGHPLKVPSLPEVAAAYQAYHARALAHFGLKPRAGRGQVGIVLAGFQQRCFTYVSVNPLQGDCGLAKLNLQPAEWREEADRVRYLDALAPELISGDPLSLAELAALPMRHRPRALLSTSMALHGGLRRALEQRFGCPVLDLYSMNEVGPIGVYDPALDGFLLLQPHLHVEIVDAGGEPLPWGRHGEIVVSGGFNPCLPLLRYRTGDHARLDMSPHGPILRDLQGRAPVRFRTPGGKWINNIELTQALAPLALIRFALHQQADGRLRLYVDSREPLAVITPALRAAVEARFGGPVDLEIAPLVADDKLRQYTSDLAGAATPC